MTTEDNAAGADPRIVNLDETPETIFKPDAEVESHVRDIGRAVGCKRIGLRIQRVPPGKRSSWRHRHLFQEEILLVLSGEGMLVHGDRRTPVRAMDCVAYLPSDATAHTFHNTGSTDLVIAAFGDHLAHEVCVYPDQGTAFVSGLGGLVPLDVAQLAKLAR